MASKLFVGGLSWDTTDDKLKDFFASAGTVVSAVVILDKYTGKSRGFGFVEMATQEEAEKAKTSLNGQTLDGRAIAVNDAKPQAPREDRFSGGGGGGGFGGGGRDRRGGGGGAGRGRGRDRGDRRDY